MKTNRNNKTTPFVGLLLCAARMMTLTALLVAVVGTSIAVGEDGWMRMDERSPINRQQATAAPASAAIPAVSTRSAAQIPAVVDPTSPIDRTNYQTQQQKPTAPVVPKSVEPCRAVESAAQPSQPLSMSSVVRRPAASLGGALPAEHGQVWREYDIREYSRRVATTNRPEQAVIDWILRETGYERWHGRELAMLSATPHTLRAYHTPEMQAVVGAIVDRFVMNADSVGFSLRVATVEHPSWRAMAHNMMKPIPVTTAGVSAWMVDRENLPVLLSELRRRGGYREHSSPHLLVDNGQSTVISARRGRQYVKDVRQREDAWPGVQAEAGRIDEGFSLEFSPLLTVDRQVADAVIKCDIDQVEKMVPIYVNSTSQTGESQRVKVEVPQMTQLRFQERFRFPADKVLIVGLGMVALPIPIDSSREIIPGLPFTMPGGPPRADLVIMIESQTKK